MHFLHFVLYSFVVFVFGLGTNESFIKVSRDCLTSSAGIGRYLELYLLGDGEADDGVPLQDLPRDHGGVDLNLPDGHIERRRQQGVLTHTHR